MGLRAIVSGRVPLESSIGFGLFQTGQRRITGFALRLCAGWRGWSAGLHRWAPRFHKPAPKGPNEIAQGEALGKRPPPNSRPERAAWRAGNLVPPRHAVGPLPIPPFQGSSSECCGDPGLRPGLSHAALSGPGPDIVPSSAWTYPPNPTRLRC